MQGEGVLTTAVPDYNAVTKRFSQTMEFRSPGPKIDSYAIDMVMRYAEQTFVRVLFLNGLTDYAWPPDEVEVVPHADFQGAAFMFATRADKPRQIVIQ